MAVRGDSRSRLIIFRALQGSRLSAHSWEVGQNGVDWFRIGMGLEWSGIAGG